MRRRGLGTAIGALILASMPAASARAGTFDALGVWQLDPAAVATIDFEKDPDRLVPSDADPKCVPPGFTRATKDDALEGASYAELRLLDGCAERFLVSMPQEQGSYRASLWMRHGGLDAFLDVLYPDGSGLDPLYVALTPTGRTTSDGWVELATNDFPVDGMLAANVYLKVTGYAAVDAVDVDGVEIVRSGEYWAQGDCDGAADPSCGPEAACIWSRCVLGRLALPVLPADAIRDDVVDMLASQMRSTYGGHFSRVAYLPGALAHVESMRKAHTAWEFWSRWATGVHALHDWHTDTNMGITGGVGPRRRLNACFIEGDADLSHGVWPKDTKYADILVSHVGGADNAGLAPGDRLIAVDGLHPVAWAASLGAVDWGFHVATDPDVFADFVEGLGGPYWAGGSIIKYARTITVIRCDASGCNGAPETIDVQSLGGAGGGPDVVCDNRPLYHLDGADVPDPATHHVFGHIFRGAITGTTPTEAIYGMTWDTLWGGGDPNGGVNGAIKGAIADWKASARGVILDHRAGNGGTIDAATNVTRLARPAGVAAVLREPLELPTYGPLDPALGLSFYTNKRGNAYDVGDADWAQDLPVALILHRDGSASDYMPYGMKGAPNVRLFGPHQTAGAFSTYVEFSSWGGLYFQYGSGDTIGPDGGGLIGHGVQPDEVVLPTQSDLRAGKDTIFEAALAWVRQELKP